MRYIKCFLTSKVRTSVSSWGIDIYLRGGLSEGNYSVDGSDTAWSETVVNSNHKDT